jgi:hypothetical protein
MAVGLLTERDLSVLGEGLRRTYPLDPEPDFLDLLAQIDEAERELAQKKK